MKNYTHGPRRVGANPKTRTLVEARKRVTPSVRGFGASYRPFADKAEVLLPGADESVVTGSATRRSRR